MTSSNPAVSSASSIASATPGRLGLWVMLSGTFLVVLDFFIVNVALPSMQHDLQASAGTLQLVVAGYGLATAAGLVTGGRLGDLFGRRRMFMLGLLLFTLASAACGVAPNAGLLVAARLLQGLAGALLQPQVLAMIGLAYAGEDRTRAFAAYGLTLGLAATLGQLVGGALIHADLAGLGWRSCFLINVPIGLLALVLAPRVVPPLAQGRGDSRLDLAGMALVAAGSVAVVLPLVEGRQQGWPLWSWLCLAVAVPLWGLFAGQQRRLAARGGAPLVAPVLLANRRFVTGLFTTLAFYAGNASFYFVLALYLQQGWGWARSTRASSSRRWPSASSRPRWPAPASPAASAARHRSHSAPSCSRRGMRCSAPTWPAGRGTRMSWRGWCRCCSCRARGSAW